MKPLFKKITDGLGYSFSFIEECPPLFNTPWHFHPEHELIYIKESTGKRFMGDHIADFDERELILVGSNLPHFWQEDATTDMTRAKAYVIHFRCDFLGAHFFNLPEASSIKKMLTRSQTGLKFTGSTRDEVCLLIEQLPSLIGFERLLLLQRILFLLSESYEVESLSSPAFVDSFQAHQEERINKVYEYVMYNFHEKITLANVAAVAYMSEVAFCRYFKTRTGKPFFHFLNEIRIGYACRLLLESDKTVAEISFESGFNNLSHFNRQFKTYTKETPQRYRELFK